MTIICKDNLNIDFTGPYRTTFSKFIYFSRSDYDKNGGFVYQMKYYFSEFLKFFID